MQEAIKFVVFFFKKIKAKSCKLTGLVFTRR